VRGGGLCTQALSGRDDAAHDVAVCVVAACLFFFLLLCHLFLGVSPRGGSGGGSGGCPNCYPGVSEQRCGWRIGRRWDRLCSVELDIAAVHLHVEQLRRLCCVERKRAEGFRRAEGGHRQATRTLHPASAENG